MLSRRIEQLAALSVEEGAPDVAGLPAALAALRADLASVRAELGGLRGEIGGVRTDLDGLSGRLTGSAAATRSETGTLARRTAELSRRIEHVGDRVEDLRSDLPQLGREVREGLGLLPARTTVALDEHSDRVTAVLNTRLEGVATDVRRLLSAAQERSADATASSAAALADTRTAVESRLAVLEDALDGVAERLEALNRDGSQQVRAQLQRMTTGLVALESRVEAVAAEQVERVVSRLREVTETRLDLLSTTLVDGTRGRSDQLRRELVDLLAEANLQGRATRTAVEQLLAGQASAVEQAEAGLGALETRTTEAGIALREQLQAELDVVAERLVLAVRSLEQASQAQASEIGARADARQESFDQRLEVVRAGVATGLAELRSDMATELGVQRPQVEELVAAAQAAAEVGSELRAEMTSSLTTVRQQTVAALAASADAVQVGLDRAGSAAREAAQEARAALLAQLEEQHSLVTGRLADLTAAASGGERGERGERALTERLAALVGSHEDLLRSVESLHGDWPVRVAEAQAAARTTVEGALGELRTEVRSRLDDVLAEVGRAAGSVDRARVELSAAAEEVGAAVAQQRAEAAGRTRAEQAELAARAAGQRDHDKAEAKANRLAERAAARDLPRARPAAAKAAAKAGATKAGATKAGATKPGATKPGATKPGAAGAGGATPDVGNAEPATMRTGPRQDPAKTSSATRRAAAAEDVSGTLPVAVTPAARRRLPKAAAPRASRPRPVLTGPTEATERTEMTAGLERAAPPRRRAVAASRITRTPNQPMPEGPSPAGALHPAALAIQLELASQPEPPSQPEPASQSEPASQPEATTRPEPMAQPGPEPAPAGQQPVGRSQPRPAEQSTRRRFGRRR